MVLVPIQRRDIEADGLMFTIMMKAMCGCMQAS